MLLPSEEGTTENGLNTFVLTMAQVQARIWPRQAYLSPFDRQQHYYRGRCPLKVQDTHVEAVLARTSLPPLLPNEHGTRKTVKARLRPWLSGHKVLRIFEGVTLQRATPR